MRRYKMQKKASRRLFSKTAQRVDRRNSSPSPLRGGFRL